MKKNFQKQFEAMRDLMQSNITTIKALLEQSENLSEIIQGMGENDATCAPIREKLLEVQGGINSKLDELTDQTLLLHASYKDLVGKVFDS